MRSTLELADRGKQMALFKVGGSNHWVDGPNRTKH